MDQNPRASMMKTDTEEKKSFQQLAYEYVKNQIISLELKPAQYVADSDVARNLGISRTPAREALRRLEQEGLLVSEYGQGWKVYAMTLEDIENIFEIKIALEGILAKKAAKCEDPGMKSLLSETFQDMRAAARDKDFAAWQDADLRFHNVMLNMCSNKRAQRIVNNLNDQWYRLRPGIIALEGRLDRSIDEHEAIVSSVLAGDGEGAEREMRKHLMNVQEELARVLAFVLDFVPEGV